MILKEKFSSILPAWRQRVSKLVSESGDVVVDRVTVSQIYGGMRNIKGLVTDISYVDPVEGIRFRGYTIPEVIEMLPKPEGAEMPYVGGLYYLLLVGEIPTPEDALDVERTGRSAVKSQNMCLTFCVNALRYPPNDDVLYCHPGFAERVSFRRSLPAGIRKDAYWEAALEDSLNLTAKLPTLAAFIYQLKFKNGGMIPPDFRPGLGCEFCPYDGRQDKEYRDMSRLYFLLHSDHESGNVSAHATHLVGSTLADIYYASSAAMNGLAGPLHGLANQECLRWLLDVYEKFKGVPTKEQLRQFAWDTLNSGQVIPGYGHAVLRKTDPRFTAQFEFRQQAFPGR